MQKEIKLLERSKKLYEKQQGSNYCNSKSELQ